MESVLLPASYGAVAALALHIFFRSVRHRWPESYSTLRGALESFVARSLWHYVIFRTVPVYMTAVFLAVTVSRLGFDPAVAVVVMTGVHIGTTNVWAMVVVLRGKGTTPRRGALLLFYFIAALLIVAMAIAAVLTFRAWAGLIPVPRDAVFALWTGLIAAVLAAYVQGFKKPDPTEEEVVTRARVASQLWWKSDERGFLSVHLTRRV